MQSKEIKSVAASCLRWDLYSYLTELDLIQHLKIILMNSKD